MAIHGNNYDYSNYGWNFKMVTFFNEKIRYFIQIINEFKVNVQGVVPNFIFTQYMQVTNPMHHASKTVVVAYINTMKTTFDLHFEIYQAVKQHTNKHGNKEKLSIINCL